jgi:hypothetical protein
MIASEICDEVVCFVPPGDIRANMIEPLSLGLEHLFMIGLAQRRHGVMMMKVRCGDEAKVHGWVVDAFGTKILSPLRTGRNRPRLPRRTTALALNKASPARLTYRMSSNRKRASPVTLN